MKHVLSVEFLGVSLSEDESTQTVGRRFRSVLSLYTNTYVDESWINQAINLLPRMRNIIANGCPGTKLAITEFNFGDEKLWSSALVTAEALAIFGREVTLLPCPSHILSYVLTGSGHGHNLGDS